MGAPVTNSIAVLDNRPFFDRAVRYGLDHGILGQDDIKRFLADAPKGLVQIADHFGTAFLRIDLETAVTRMVNLASLYLEHSSNGDLQVAARSLRDNTLLSHSRGGSEMLKQLHAMPMAAIMPNERPDPAFKQMLASDQKAFVNERSFAYPLTVEAYRQEVRARQANQMQIDFARWLLRRLRANAAECEIHAAEDIVRSVLLVLYAGGEPLELPSKSQFVKLVQTLRDKRFKYRPAGLDAFLKEAPEDFARLCRQAMEAFVAEDLPRLLARDKTPAQLLNVEQDGFFTRDAPEEEMLEYDKLVAEEWVRVTKGKAGDPAVLATLFLCIATGQPPKPAALLKEAKAIIAAFRSQGFDSPAVLAFIDEHAPFEQREALKEMWLQDLMPDAEIHLADNDPQMPDSYMERALQYFRQNCVASWKGRA
ncbi:MAG: hypothetical protein D3M94_03540 [Rhodocyclales bacterium GT-UBC]|nr:MAG: hypothetical protein D3M94_03540 [Rhodocyclales bacterium GT-UBC]